MTNRPAALAACFLALAAALPALAIDRHRVWHEGREIDVVDRGGWALYQGDIIVGPTAQVLERSLREGPDGKRIGTITAKSSTLGTSGGRWPRGTSGLFEIPYVAESDPDARVPAAVAAFNDALAGFMRAVPRTTEADYVAFTLSATDTTGACFSSIGHVGGRQAIQGSRTCGTGVLVHEMGHAIGLYHEQEHGDHASYVQITLANVEPSRAANYVPSTNQRNATPYDFASLMHYASTGFSREGDQTLETIPPGIAIGQRVGYSAADLEGIRRLYGSPPQQITVTSFPAGLTVLVDGVATITPATFSWSIGSTHVLDVASNAQALNGAAHVFGRWNVDRGGDLAARRIVSIVAGEGTITAPSTHPAVSTYTASFVRHKEVRLTTSGNRAGVGGSVSAVPAPAGLSGVTGTYYRERQPFTLEPIANPGARFGGWNGSYLYVVANTTSYRNPFRGPVAFSDTMPAAYEYRAFFVDFPLLTIRARSQEGEVLGLHATIAPSGAASTDQRLPYNGVSWTSGQAGTVSTEAIQDPFAPSLRYVFRDWDGDPAPTIGIASPAVGQPDRTVTANFSKEYQAFRQVIPSCAGSITLPGDASTWFAHGSNVAVSLAMVSGWVFTGWSGSLSGTSNPTGLAVTDFPDLTARLNTVSTPLTVSAVAPVSIRSGASATLDITGTGFTSSSEVYVRGIRQSAQFVSATRLTAIVAAADFPASGLAIVTVTNRPGASTCSVSASGSVDVTASAEVVPQTGWWWNAAESGRGFFIEKRGANLFMAGYYYEADGRATWFTAAGAMSGSTFSGDMTVFRGGQSLTGAYRAPNPGTSPGRVTLSFGTASSATLTWPGGVTALTRFAFGSGGAGLPENGWWWNAAESGRGYSIEIQGNAIFMVGFMYDEAGNPLWYFAQGTINSASAFDGAWQQAANGQTLTGPYRAPIFLTSSVGNVTVSFTGSRTATLVLPNGRQLAITRFDF
jgi:Astacin (Peptidase family M12A)